MTLPDLTIDMDGVLCRPIAWFNLAISRDVRRSPDLALPRPSRSLPHRIVETPAGQVLRYGWRPCMPRVGEGLADLADLRRLVLLSGRPESARRATEGWLRRHGLRDYFAEVVLNDRRLPNASFKLQIARERRVDAHVDDDGRVAYFLATDAPRTVYLISWHGNAGLPYPPGVHRVRTLVDAAKHIRQSLSASEDGASRPV